MLQIVTGCEDDGSGCRHFWGLLVATECVPPDTVSGSRNHLKYMVPACCSDDLLASNEQFHVQSNNLLLDEHKVS